MYINHGWSQSLQLLLRNLKVLKVPQDKKSNAPSLKLNTERKLVFQPGKVVSKEQSFVSQICLINNRIISSLIKFILHQSFGSDSDKTFWDVIFWSIHSGEEESSYDFKGIWEDSSEFTNFFILVRNLISLYKRYSLTPPPPLFSNNYWPSGGKLSGKANVYSHLGTILGSTEVRWGDGQVWRAWDFIFWLFLLVGDVGSFNLLELTHLQSLTY